MAEPSSRTVAALVHEDCGHVAGVADEHQTLDDQAEALGVRDPRWRHADLDIDDAVERLLAGPCPRCGIETAP